ncbi:MAG: hypothetical protein U1E51_10595 [Candidatus Binatia bacterium]|nr:hypothetical protein [Candidatus Binatia bacterium]
MSEVQRRGQDGDELSGLVQHRMSKSERSFPRDPADLVLTHGEAFAGNGQLEIDPVGGVHVPRKRPSAANQLAIQR